MKIGFLTSEFPHPKTGNAGGIGTSLLNLTKGLVQAGHQVTLLIYGQKEDEIFEENGIVFHRIKNIKLKGFSRFLTQKKIEKKINSLFINRQIDLVEAADWTGITSFIKPNCPVVIRLHGSDTYFCHLDQRPVKAINRFHEKRALQNADGLLSVSRYTANVTKELFVITKEFTIIPNAIDLQKFDVSAANNTIQPHTILYFGTLIRKKGLLELPLIFNEVFQKNNQAKLLLIGRDSGDVLSGNKSTWKIMQPLFAAEAFKNVTYAGSVPYEQMRKNIDGAAVCVFPTFAEALPVSWIEAMAMKKPIVASDIGWAPELIDDGINGYLVHPKKHTEFADKIIKLLGNPELQHDFGIQARIKAEQNFGLQTVAAQSVAFYEKVIQQKQKKQRHDRNLP